MLSQKLNLLAQFLKNPMVEFVSSEESSNNTYTFHEILIYVVVFAHPFEKYAQVKLDHETPRIGVNIPKIFELPPRKLVHKGFPRLIPAFSKKSWVVFFSKKKPTPKTTRQKRPVASIRGGSPKNSRDAPKMVPWDPYLLWDSKNGSGIRE